MAKDTLLWVDDDHQRYPAMHSRLKETFDLIACESYERGAHEAKARLPKCCILDVILPFDDRNPSLGDHVGLTLCRKVCDSDKPPAAVVFLSIVPEAEIGLSDLRRDFSLVSFEYMSKNELALGSSHVVDSVRRILDGAGRAPHE